MGVSRLNVWVSEVADPCGTWNGSGFMSVMDCKGVLRWECGRFLDPAGEWQPVPNGEYRHIPFRCGHLEVELPPGCYWVVAGYTIPAGTFIHFNGTTHVGVVEVGCGETACVKLFNPTARLCWNWFYAGLRVLAANPKSGIDQRQADEIREAVAGVVDTLERQPIDETVERLFEELLEQGGGQ